jgi:hypothetical protein
VTEFQGFPKIPRLNREIIITEKIDGTNASVVIVREETGGEDDGLVAAKISLGGHPQEEKNGTFLLWAGARNNYRQPGKNDNYGFAHWVWTNAPFLVDALGPGRHFGEWWGPGINRGYGQKERTFSLFNTHKWGEAEGRKALSLDLEGGRVRVVPVLYQGPWHIAEADNYWAPTFALDKLRAEGSKASPGFMRPEGIVVFHTAGGALFKATLEGDEKPKGLS